MNKLKLQELREMAKIVIEDIPKEIKLQKIDLTFEKIYGTKNIFSTKLKRMNAWKEFVKMEE